LLVSVEFAESILINSLGYCVIVSKDTIKDILENVLEKDLFKKKVN
jgi:hypothetical protein